MGISKENLLSVDRTLLEALASGASLHIPTIGTVVSTNVIYSGELVKVLKIDESVAQLEMSRLIDGVAARLELSSELLCDEWFKTRLAQSTLTVSGVVTISVNKSASQAEIQPSSELKLYLNPSTRFGAEDIYTKAVDSLRVVKIIEPTPNPIRKSEPKAAPKAIQVPKPAPKQQPETKATTQPPKSSLSDKIIVVVSIIVIVVSLVSIAMWHLNSQ